jgi:hypothetical protein
MTTGNGGTLLAYYRLLLYLSKEQRSSKVVGVFI